MVVQAMEKTEDGLSTVEMRAFRDLAESVGASKMRLLNTHQPLSPKEVMELLKSKESF